MEAVLAQSTPSSADLSPRTKGQRWAGIVLSALPVAFLVFDGAMKVVPVPPVLEAMARMGYPETVARPIGLVLLVCLALYLFPRTAVLGAVLLTGYLGGAVATHVRVEDPLFSHTLFPAVFGAMLWGGLYLRDVRLRAIAPWRR